MSSNDKSNFFRSLALIYSNIIRMSFVLTVTTSILKQFTSYYCSTTQQQYYSLAFTSLIFGFHCFLKGVLALFLFL